MGKATMAATISGWSDKRSMTVTFTITLNGKFLPMQLIYGGKTNQSSRKFDFPVGFSLSANPKHYSNTGESIMLIKEIIIPYIEKERISLKLFKPEPALLIMDLVRGQKTEDILTALKDNNILLVRVLSNSSCKHDLTVNGTFKTFMCKKISE